MSGFDDLLKDKKDKSLKIVKYNNYDRCNYRALYANKMLNYSKKIKRLKVCKHY